MVTFTVSGQSASELEARLLVVSQEVDDAISTLEQRWRRPFRDPDTRKYLERISDALSDLTRLLLTGSFPAEQQRRLLVLLDVAHARLNEVTTESVWLLLRDFQLLLIAVGDAEVICGLVAGELQWRKAQTSWLTWDSLFKGDEGKSKALDLYLAMLGDARVPWAVAVLGGALLDTPIARAALERGGHLRVGLEDWDTGPANVEQVAAAAQLCRRIGREVARVDDAGTVLGLPA